jgi:hypothetical protein
MVFLSITRRSKATPLEPLIQAERLIDSAMLKNPPGVNRRALAMIVKCCQRSMPTVMLRPITWPIFAVFASNFVQAGSFAIPSCALPCASQLG